MPDKSKALVIPGEISISYKYSAGLAGTRFLNELKDNAKFMATRCKKCGYTMMPPRIFCEDCFVDDVEWIEVSKTGKIVTFAVSYMSTDGKRLKDPWMLAVVKIDGTDGGLLVRLEEVKPDDVKIGMNVEAVLIPKNERKGMITDIKYFKPSK